MFDDRLRRHLDRPLATAAARLDRTGISPDRLTLAGLVLGLLSAGLAAGQWWGWALVCWLLSRALDGLDGPLARRRAAAGNPTDGTTPDGAAPTGRSSAAGGFFDITADFTVYGAGVVGVAIGVTGPDAGPGAWLPFLAVLLAYYVNGTAFLAFSSIAERAGHRIDDGRSLSFMGPLGLLGRLAEGAETIAVHSLWLIVPSQAPVIAAVWALVVGLSGLGRIVVGYRTLAAPPPHRDDPHRDDPHRDDPHRDESHRDDPSGEDPGPLDGFR